MNNLISKRDAINAAIEATDGWDSIYNIGRQKRIEKIIMALPSIDIIQCKECMYSLEEKYTGKIWCERYTDAFVTEKNGFCSKGEEK